MKKLFWLLLIVGSCASEKQLNQRKQNYLGEEILIGEVTIEGIQEEPFKEWFDYFYQDYIIDSSQLITIAEDLESTEIVIFLGTWCSDSQYQVPGFLKMLR
jgi:hypothetical protein